ncbi:MAG: glycosyltransferase family 4 protein [Thermoguttaceae bacterium]|nr:glycosyltransferase family 4 protein [Thermoguttaceae bacterium]MDW8078820.1 glycosyltransferase family 4 protein [Thermoguttaceae bacterium]
MRIAHIITRLIIGGAQENTLLCCEDLINLFGEDVLLITGPPLGPEGSLVDRAIRNRVPLKIIPWLRREIHPWRDLRSYWAIRRVLQVFRPDVVHTHSAKGGILGRLAAYRLRVPVIVHTVHGAPFHPYQHFVAREFCRLAEVWAARYCDIFITVANAMRTLLVQGSIAPPEKCITIYSGMEIEPFVNCGTYRQETRRKLGFSADEVVVGKVARLFPLKGHDDVIEAAGPVIAQNPKVRFLFVGGGILENDLKKKIQDKGLADYFAFTGLIPPEKLPAVISAMDILVHTSLREGLARVLPQALLAGIPVISYDVDGAREVVIPEKTGILLPARDVAGLASAILRLAQDPAIRRQFGEAGRLLCQEIFPHEKMTREIHALYCKLLRSKGYRVDMVG